MEEDNIKIQAVRGTWRQVADCANNTINMDEGEVEPSPRWKKRMLLSEHSPIREIQIDAKWKRIKYWIAMHLCRHKYGIEHYVGTQRSDRTGVPRDNLPQGALVPYRFSANAQAILTISRKRLCLGNPAKETREQWMAFLDKLKDYQPELVSVCVPDCVYRGWCYEMRSCGYSKTEEYKEELTRYRNTEK